MSKKTIFIGIISIFAFVIFFFPVQTLADQYYDQYPGVGFLPTNESKSYFKDGDVGYFYSSDTTSENFYCPVTFNVPDGSVYFIKSIGIRYLDNRTDGHFHVVLKRKNLYTGNVHQVAIWESDWSAASSSEQTASKATESGVKLVDTKKFVYWLNVEFCHGVTPHALGLILYQVRIHYGT